MERTNKQEKWISCCQLRADNKVHRAAELKNDSIILAVHSDELIAKEASYSPSCYKNYSALCQKNQIKNTESCI